MVLLSLVLNDVSAVEVESCKLSARLSSKVAFLPLPCRTTFGCSLRAAVTGQAMVGPTHRKHAPNGQSTVAQRPAAAQFFAELAVNVPLPLLAAAVAILGVLFANPAAAASTTGVYSAQPVFLFGIPVVFIMFSMTLLGWRCSTTRRSRSR